MTAKASRDEARDEVTDEVYRILMDQLGATAWRERDRAQRIATMLTNPTRFDRLAALLGYVKADDAVTVEQCRLIAREARATGWDEGHSFAGFEAEPDDNPYRT